MPHVAAETFFIAVGAFAALTTYSALIAGYRWHRLKKPLAPDDEKLTVNPGNSAAPKD